MAEVAYDLSNADAHSDDDVALWLKKEWDADVAYNTLLVSSEQAVWLHKSANSTKQYINNQKVWLYDTPFGEMVVRVAEPDVQA